MPKPADKDRSANRLTTGIWFFGQRRIRRFLPEAETNPGMRIGNLQHYQWLKGIVAFICVLNVIDGILTLVWISTGRAEEANPFMNELILRNPILFMVGKLILVFLGTWLLWRMRRVKAAVIAVFGIFLAYYAVLIYHLKSMDLRLIQQFFD